jgi:multisubunit Na+/H+ antiporter MnhG subunit
VIPALAYALLALSGAAGVWGLLTAVLDKAPGKAQLLFAAGVWVVTVVQSVIGLVRVASGYRPLETATTVGYLLAILIIIPLAWFWANNERTRWSGVVLAVAAFSVLAMTLRLLQLWTQVAA